MEGGHDHPDQGEPGELYTVAQVAKVSGRAAGDGAGTVRGAQDLQRELGCLGGRLELTARAESTAHEDLERIATERDAKREREQTEDLRRELEAERRKASGPGCSASSPSGAFFTDPRGKTQPSETHSIKSSGSGTLLHRMSLFCTRRSYTKSYPPPWL